MKKLEELLKSANSLISALSADELPQAFRLAFKLLDQTGRTICLSKTGELRKTPKEEGPTMMRKKTIQKRQAQQNKLRDSFGKLF
ncbi:hypothetical protein TSMEX_011092 [Taenia solium]|eukprot:TsM_000790600 transcript=TsM_000790600 gene=TsM_000790600